MKKDICSLIEKRVVFNQPSCALSDHASHFGLLENKPEMVGIGHLLVFYNRLFKELSDFLVQIYLYSETETRVIPANNPKIAFHPYGITQTLTIGQIQVDSAVVFTKTNHLNFSVSFSVMEKEETIRPIFFGQLKPGLDISAKYEERDRILKIRQEIPRLDARDPDESFIVNYELNPVFDVKKVLLKESLAPTEVLKDAPSLVFEGKGQLAYAITGEAVRLEPDKPGKFSIQMRFWINDYLPSEFVLTPDPIRSACTRWNNILKRVPEPQSDEPGLKSLYYHAHQVLLNNLYAPIGPIFRQHCASFANKGGYDVMFPLDTTFQSFGLLRFYQKLTYDALNILLENQHRDGKFPCFLTTTWERPGPTTQVTIGLDYWKYYLKTNDKGFLSRAYAGLSRSIEWWFKNRDPDGDGLCEYYVAPPVDYMQYVADGVLCQAGVLCQELWDNSPRWDKGQAEAVDLSAFLLLESKILSQMALELGLKDESKEWIMKAGRLSQRILELMYDEKDNLFYDLLPSHKFSRVLTPACFLPLWAGVNIEESKSRDMIEKYLLNPEHFYGKIPFPTVAYSEPSYEHDSFWRGSFWPGIAYFMLQILYQYGYESEADEAANRLLQMAVKEPYISEYYDSQSGKGMGTKSYGWTAGIIIEMILKGYKDPII